MLFYNLIIIHSAMITIITDTMLIFKERQFI